MCSCIAGDCLTAFDQLTFIEFDIVFSSIKDSEIFLRLSNESAGVGIILYGDLNFSCFLHFSLENLFLDDFRFLHFACFEMGEV